MEESRMRIATMLVGLGCFGVLCLGGLGGLGCKGGEGEPCQSTADCQGDLMCCFDVNDSTQELGECVPTSECRPCGNGDLDGDEACDDGNQTVGDGCDDGCAVESGWACTGSPSACVELCGDGVVSAPDGEECDDGNTDNGDGCSADCMIEVEIECGNGDVETGEECDDGNTDSGDGCSADCELEVLPGCGNGVREAGEQCDGPLPFDASCELLGYLTGTVGCTASCTMDYSDCMNHPDQVAWYRLDGTEGLVTDSGLWSNDCVEAGTLVRDATGVVGRAAIFDGTSAYVDCGAGSNLDGMAALTVEAWVYLSSYGGESMFVSRAATGDATGLVYALGVAGNASWGAHQNHAYFATYDLASAVFSADPLPTDEWHHVAGVYETGEVTIYVDGAATGSATSLTTTHLPSPTDARLYLGHLYDGGTTSTWDTYLDGALDDVRIWRVARDAGGICIDAGGTLDGSGICQLTLP
jgi:cysteine-rich repeat protein